jgi:hypothetical protein
MSQKAGGAKDQYQPIDNSLISVTVLVIAHTMLTQSAAAATMPYRC